uniref:Transmembrane protein 39A (inferred by orthology to a human protein) n=2 Tax=Strongyloides TaxID=6247 RepID=A0A0K0F7Y3_STRVS
MFSKKASKPKIPASKLAKLQNSHQDIPQNTTPINNYNSNDQIKDDFPDCINEEIIKKRMEMSIRTYKTSIHKPWPKIPKSQSKLFFECTLFLYSVLALFLQYLNIYKTLWWLPKSYWHYSMKLHLVNPYLLSCVGLILGARVTKCFWETVSQTLEIAGNYFPKYQAFFVTFVEYFILKLPMMALITSSFFFSFVKIYKDYPISKVMYFLQPIILFAIIFRNEIFSKIKQFYLCFAELKRFDYNITHLIRNLKNFFLNFFKDPYYLDVEYVQHFCGANPYYAKGEFQYLSMDLSLRVRHALFVGISTAYLAILIPCIFTPVKSVTGNPIYMHLDYMWIFELFIIVALTSFSLYIAFLIPIHYLDLFHKNAVHLGCFEKLPENEYRAKVQKWEPYYEYKANTIVEHNGIQYLAIPHELVNSCVAEPGNISHYLCYKLNADPVLIPNILIFYQAFLIAFQFWMLCLTIDWQHIVTLVLLMFANFLLLAKFFKDRVVLGRIHNPTFEDMKLISELKNELSITLMKEKQRVYNKE